METVTVPLLPDAVWLGESSGNYCLSSPPGTSLIRCVARCASPLRSAMLHSSETWGPTTSNLEWLCHNGSTMTHWICGTKDQDETPSASRKKLGIKDIMRVLMVGGCDGIDMYSVPRPVLYSNLSDLILPSPRGKGRPRKAWSECVNTDISACGLAGIDPQDREARKASVRHSLMLPTPLDETRTASLSKNGYGIMMKS